MTEKNSHLQTDHLMHDLKVRAIRGAGATFAGQWAKLVLQIGSTVVLARLLTPEDFGLVALVSLLTGFLYMFSNLGLSDAVVQQEDVNQAQMSTLFWINVLLGLLLMLLTMALAPAVVWFYDEPRLFWITIALSTGFMMIGLGVQQQALLRRQMRFSVLAANDVISLVCGVVAAFIGVWLGLGYWSLVLMQLATTLSATIGMWISCRWAPGLPKRGANVRSMLIFGGYRTYSNIVAYFTRNIDKVLVGAAYGPQLAGLYSKAFSLLMLPVQQISAPLMNVMVPTLSRLRNDPGQFRDYYMKSVKLLAYASMPMAAAMGALSVQIVWLALGEQWTRAGLIFKILAFTAFWLPVAQSAIWVYLALGNTRRMAIWFTIACPITVLAFVAGLPWEAEGVATADALTTWVLLYPLLWFCFKGSPVSVYDVATSVARPFILSAVLYLTMEAAGHYLDETGIIASLIGTTTAGIVAIVLLLATSSSIRADLLAHRSVIKGIFVKPRPQLKTAPAAHTPEA